MQYLSLYDFTMDNNAITALAVGSWQLAVGSWQLAVGSWQKSNRVITHCKPFSLESVTF